MMIQTDALSKRYDDHLVVDALTLQIDKGQIFGLLGPNAAGKSTTIRMLAGIIKPSSGSAHIAGRDLFKDADAIKQKIGYVSQHFGLYAELTVLENIRFYAELYGIDDVQRIHHLLSKYEIEAFAHTRAGRLSGGYQRRLALVCALVHDPQLLFLDEPTAGIDPVTRKMIWDIFYALVSEGKTLFVTTHYMEEAERCTELAFLDHGKIIAKGSPKAVQDSLVDYDIYAFNGTFEHTMLESLEHEEDVVLINQFGKVLRIMVDHSLHVEQLKALMHPFVKDEIVLQKSRPNLEDVFIALTQGRKR